MCSVLCWLHTQKDISMFVEVGRLWHLDMWPSSDCSFPSYRGRKAAEPWLQAQVCFQCLLTPPAAAAFPNGKSEQENIQNLSDHTEMRSKCSGSSTSFSFSFNPTNAVLIRVGSFHFFQHKLAPCQTQLLPFSRFLVLFCICLLPYARLCFTGARSVACFVLFFACSPFSLQPNFLQRFWTDMV